MDKIIEIYLCKRIQTKPSFLEEFVALQEDNIFASGKDPTELRKKITNKITFQNYRIKNLKDPFTLIYNNNDTMISHYYPLSLEDYLEVTQNIS